MDRRAIKCLDMLAERLVDLEIRNELPKQTAKSCKKWLFGALSNLSVGRLKMELSKYWPLHAKRFFRAVKKARQLHLSVKSNSMTERHPENISSSTASSITSPRKLDSAIAICPVTISSSLSSEEENFKPHTCNSAISCKLPTRKESCSRTLPGKFATTVPCRPATLPYKVATTATSFSEAATSTSPATITSCHKTESSKCPASKAGHATLNSNSATPTTCAVVTSNSSVSATKVGCSTTQPGKLPAAEMSHEALDRNPVIPATCAIVTSNSPVSVTMAGCSRTPPGKPPAMAGVSPAAVMNNSVISSKFPTTQQIYRRPSLSKSANTTASCTHSVTSNTDTSIKFPATKAKVIYPRKSLTKSPIPATSAKASTAPCNSTRHCCFALTPYSLFTEHGVRNAVESAMRDVQEEVKKEDGVTATRVLNLMAIVHRSKQDTEYEQISTWWRTKKFVHVSSNVDSISEMLGRESTFQFSFMDPPSLKRLMNQTLQTMEVEVDHIRHSGLQKYTERASTLSRHLHYLLAYFHFKHGILTDNGTHEEECDSYYNIMAALLSLSFELGALLARSADSDASILGNQSLSKACLLLRGNVELLMSIFLHMSTLKPDDAAFLLPTLDHVICHPPSRFTAHSYIKYILVCRMARHILQYSHHAQLSVYDQMSQKAVPPSDLGSWVTEHWSSIAPEILFDGWPAHLTTFLLQVASHDLCHRLRLCITSLECPALVRGTVRSSCKQTENLFVEEVTRTAESLSRQGVARECHEAPRKGEVSAVDEGEQSRSSYIPVSAKSDVQKQKSHSLQETERVLIPLDEASELEKEKENNTFEESEKVCMASDQQEDYSHEKCATVSALSEVKKKKTKTKKNQSHQEIDKLLITQGGGNKVNVPEREKQKSKLRESEKVSITSDEQENSSCKKHATLSVKSDVTKKKKKKKNHSSEESEMIVTTPDKKNKRTLKKSGKVCVKSKKQDETDVKKKKKKKKNPSPQESELILITPDGANELGKDKHTKKQQLSELKESGKVSVKSKKQDESDVKKKKKKKKNPSPQESELILITPDGVNELGKDKHTKKQQRSELKESGKISVKSKKQDELDVKKKKKEKKKNPSPQESELLLITPDGANELGKDKHRKKQQRSELKESGKVSVISDEQENSCCRKDVCNSATSDVKKKKKKKKNCSNESESIPIPIAPDLGKEKRVTTCKESKKVSMISDVQVNPICGELPSVFESDLKKIHKTKSLLQDGENVLGKEKRTCELKESEKESVTSDVKKKKKKKKNCSPYESEIILITTDGVHGHGKEKQRRELKESEKVSVTSDVKEKKKKKKKNCSPHESEIIFITPDGVSELGKEKHMRELKESEKVSVTSDVKEKKNKKKKKKNRSPHGSEIILRTPDAVSELGKEDFKFASVSANGLKKKKKKKCSPQMSELTLIPPDKANELEIKKQMSTLKKSEKLSATSLLQEDSSCRKDANVSAASNAKKKKNHSCKESKIILITSDEETELNKEKQMSAFEETGKFSETSDNDENSRCEIHVTDSAKTDALKRDKKQKKNRSTHQETEKNFTPLDGAKGLEKDKQANANKVTEKTDQTSCEIEMCDNLTQYVQENHQRHKGKGHGQKEEKRMTLEEREKETDASDYDMDEEKQIAVRNCINKVVSNFYITGDVSRAILEKDVSSSAKDELVRELDPDVWKIRNVSETQPQTSVEEVSCRTGDEMTASNTALTKEKNEESSIQLEDKYHLSTEDEPCKAIKSVDYVEESGSNSMSSITKSSKEKIDVTDGNQSMELRENNNNSKTRSHNMSPPTFSPTGYRKMNDRTEISTVQDASSYGPAVKIRSLDIVSDSEEEQVEMRAGPWRVNHLRNLSHLQTLSSSLLSSASKSRVSLSTEQDSVRITRSRCNESRPSHQDYPIGRTELKNGTVNSRKDENNNSQRMSSSESQSHQQESARVTRSRCDRFKTNDHESSPRRNMPSRTTDVFTGLPVPRGLLREAKDISSSEVSTSLVSPTSHKKSTRVIRNKQYETIHHDSSTSEQSVILRTNSSRSRSGNFPMSEGPEETTKDSPPRKRPSSSGIKCPEYPVKRQCTSTEYSDKMSVNNERDIQNFTRISCPRADKRPHRNTKSSDKVRRCESSETGNNLVNSSRMSPPPVSWAFHGCFVPSIPSYLPGGSSDDEADAPKTNERTSERMTTRSSRTKHDQKQLESTRMKQTGPDIVQKSFRRSQRLKAQSRLSSETSDNSDPVQSSRKPARSDVDVSETSPTQPRRSTRKSQGQFFSLDASSSSQKSTRMHDSDDLVADIMSPVLLRRSTRKSAGQISSSSVSSSSQKPANGNGRWGK